MVKYECFRCGYNTTHRGHLLNHLNRKNICVPTDDNIDIEQIKKHYGFENSLDPLQITPNSLKITPKSLKITPTDCEEISSKIPQKSSHLPQKSSLLPQNTTKINQCKYCNKILSRCDNLNRHMKTCKEKKEVELTMIQNEEMIKIKKESEDMKKEIEELKNFKIQTQNNITNTNSHNTTNNTNNTININNYGNENLKHLRSKDFAGLLNGIYGAVPKLIEKIHFDPDHPENQNIKFTNKKLPYLKIMKDGKWQLVHKKHELLDLIDNKCFMLKEKYYNILEKEKYNITEVQRDKIEKFMKQYNEEDKKMMLDLIERTELMLLNNS